MRTITGTTGDNGVTVHNALGTNGVPIRTTVASAISVTMSSGVNSLPSGAQGGHNGVSVNLLGGNDTLVADNMIWLNTAGNSLTGFTTISMGAGNDFVSLDRSGFGTLDLGDGNDTVNLYNSGGQSLLGGAGNDRVNIGGDFDQLSEAEIAQKDGVTLNIDGGSGHDTLNLYADWTLTLTSGAATLNNGTTVSVFTRADMTNISALPTMLAGNVGVLAGSRTLNTHFTNFESLWAVCFTAGTLIDTPNGKIAIETLKPGDLVATHGGIKPVQWIGKRRLDVVDLAANPKLLPVRIPAGAFGNGLPTKDVTFSPQHRVVVRSDIAEHMFKARDVLVPVKSLIGLNGIEIDGSAREVEYIHIAFDGHEVVQVEGIEAETFYPGPQALRMLSQDALEELRAIFPNLEDLISGEEIAEGCLPFVKGREARALVARHAKADQALYA